MCKTSQDKPKDNRQDKEKTGQDKTRACHVQDERKTKITHSFMYGVLSCHVQSYVSVLDFACARVFI